MFVRGPKKAGHLERGNKEESRGEGRMAARGPGGAGVPAGADTTRLWSGRRRGGRVAGRSRGRADIRCIVSDGGR